MRKLVILVVLLAALGFAAPVTQAATISWAELGFKSSIDGAVYYTDPSPATWPPFPAGADFSAFNMSTGLGSVTFTFSAPGTHYVAGFFDYQITDEPNNNGFLDEEAYWGSLPAGWSGKSDDPYGPSAVDPPIYDQFLAFDASNPFDNWAWNTPGHDVSVAYGYAFTLNDGDPARKVIFTVSSVAPVSGYILRQVDPLSAQSLYFSGTTQDDGVNPVPEPGTLTLVGLGVAAVARRLRRRA
ncbi:MAG: PEP-CTERM sorting domain-containing protein [Acidobacteria bacterium]|nr:PEP-CTERM sorting domain-containing protein [Acidobacteriota bacterium]